MSNIQIQPEVESGELRAQKLAAARKKLKTFRASRSSGQTSSPANTHSPSPSSSSATRSRSPAALPPLPLTESDATNARPSRNPARTKSKEILADTAVEERRKLRKPRSKGSLSTHRRQQSSISGSHVPARASMMGVFDSRPGPYAGSDTLGIDVAAMTPNEIITTPATPLADSTDIMRGLDGSQTPAGPEDDDVTRNRLSAFSFGAKPTSRSPSPSSRRPLRSSVPFEPPWNGSPLQSPSRNLSTPLSRPPSLYLTKATPLAFGSPSASGPPRGSLTASSGSPSSPPTPARKRHSHTRSDSISLPNLKLATRPNSLGFPSSPSFPASPCSPLSGNEGSARAGVSSNGQRLKFEPSGRGAEAEKEKDEYRRKALEKLTGGGRAPPITEEPQAEISLPDLDDEDVSSNSSSTRPLSDAFSTLSFGRPTSLAMSNLTSSSSSTPNGLFASPFSWSSPEQGEAPVSDRWSNGSGNFSFPSFAKDDGLGFGIDLTEPKRVSIITGLSVLAEEDENDDDDTATPPEEEHTATQPTLEPVPAAPSPSTHLPIVSPTPTRLRELTLLAHATVTPARGSTDSPLRQTSPTKGYGAIGRGRPRPLSGVMPGLSNHLSSANSTPVSGMMSTPKSANSASARRRAAPGSGSRGSSISYKKDTDSYSQSGSSRDWSGIGSPPLTSPPMSFSSPRFSGMGSVPRSNKRPCPRPASLVGLGIDGRGAGRILGEVDETDEEISNSATGRASHDSNGSWRDGHLELQLERDALKEDVAVWKERCGDLETKLEAERKETVVLRERVRKLSDRLSAVSAAPNANDQSVLVESLRKELFGLTSQFERERSEKTRLLGRVTELEARPAWKPKFESPDPPVLAPVPFSKPLLPSVLANQYQQIVAPSLYSGIPEAIVTPATPIPCDTPENVSSPDPNLYRMKAWGFPRGPVQPNRSTQRDSFFGLSSLLHRSDQNEFGDEEEAGMDLPPISFPDDVRDSHAQRAASFPEMSSNRAETNDVRSSSSSAPIGFLTSYLPKRLPISDDISPFKSKLLVEHVSPEEEVVFGGKLDFTFGCQCCVGEVIEV